jgi:hypothetical protein
MIANDHLAPRALNPRSIGCRAKRICCRIGDHEVRQALERRPMATHSTLTKGAWIEETDLSRCARCWLLLHCMSREVDPSRTCAGPFGHQRSARGQASLSRPALFIAAKRSISSLEIPSLIGYPSSQVINSGEECSQNWGCVRHVVSDDQIDGRRLAFERTAGHGPG